jgi:two-component system sensor histidine kinase DesK
VEILDDGVGARVNGARVNGAQGLDGLRRRAEAQGAHLSVGNREDGPGFRVLVEAGAAQAGAVQAGAGGDR